MAQSITLKIFKAFEFGNNPDIDSFFGQSKNAKDFILPR